MINLNKTKPWLFAATVFMFAGCVVADKQKYIVVPDEATPFEMQVVKELNLEQGNTKKTFTSGFEKEPSVVEHDSRVGAKPALFPIAPEEKVYWRKKQVYSDRVYSLAVGFHGLPGVFGDKHMENKYGVYNTIANPNLQDERWSAQDTAETVQNKIGKKDELKIFFDLCTKNGGVFEKTEPSSKTIDSYVLSCKIGNEKYNLFARSLKETFATETFMTMPVIDKQWSAMAKMPVVRNQIVPNKGELYEVTNYFVFHKN